MPANVEVVKATSENLIQAQLLINEYYASLEIVKRDTPEEIVIFLSSESSGTWIAFVENDEGQRVPAGIVVLRPLDAESHATLRQAAEAEGDKRLLTECKRLYVRDSHRGHGIAHRLLDAMEAYAATLEAAYIYLDSKDDLASALALYKKRGYVACERYNENPQATIFLRKAIQAEA